MTLTKEELSTYLVSKFRKETMLEDVQENPALIPELIRLSQLDEQPLGWRATWILRHSIDDNHRALVAVLPKIITRLPVMHESHQREWLKAFHGQVIHDDQLGVLFEVCADLWMDISHHAALRATACEWLMIIATKYEELKPEVVLLMQEDYIEILTPGIKKSLQKKAHKLKFNLR
jgi:hypothetical protein